MSDPIRDLLDAFTDRIPAPQPSEPERDLGPADEDYLR